MAKHILVDTGFWYALYNKEDHYHEQAVTINDLIVGHNILVPWPTLYETLNTRFVKRPERIGDLQKLFSKANVNLIDDLEYKEEALHQLMNAPTSKQSYSLVDLVIRELLKDNSLKIDYLITFNKRDFIDICLKRKIDIYE